jgi:hypothetical protein
VPPVGDDRQEAEDRPLTAPGGVSSKGAREGTAEPAGVPVEAAIEAALAAPGIDAVTRVHLDDARRALADWRSEAAGGFDGPTLTETLFSFVMPRLQHPDVLQAQQQLAVLEQLAGELSGQDGDTVVREGALVVHRELRRLALLRQHRSSLVEG